jgi:hypothetical protein
MRCGASTCAALVALLVVAGCGESGSGEPEESAVDLHQARSFDDYTLYYLGESFRGLPLTFAGLGSGRGTGLRRSWSFIYGDCTPPAGGDGGCAPPLEVQNWSICIRFPALYSGPTPNTSPIHGAETLPAGDGLDIYTGETTVVIFGQDRSAAVASLTRLEDETVPGELPTPAAGSLEGRLPCQVSRLRHFSD